MRKMIIALPLALSLTGCATLSPQTVTFINQVETITAQVCKFIPEATTILAIFNAGVATTVTGIATVICNAVPPPATAMYRALPRYGAAGPPVGAGHIGGIQILGWRT